MRGKALVEVTAGSALGTGAGATLELERVGGVLRMLGLDCTWSCLLGILLSTFCCLSCPPTPRPPEYVDIRLKLVFEESPAGSETMG